MNKFLKILIGVLLVLVTILIVTLIPTFSNWGHAAVELIKGGIVIALIIAGILFIFFGITELKS